MHKIARKKLSGLSPILEMHPQNSFASKPPAGLLAQSESRSLGKNSPLGFETKADEEPGSILKEQ
jgi:hypothetical protein